MTTKNSRSDWRMETLRISLGIVMLWFGMLKLVQPNGTAEQLAAETMDTITFGLLTGKTAIASVAVLECLIGLGILIRQWFRYALPLIFLHMAGTAAPLVLFPSKTWEGFLSPTFEGQYIIKNVVLVAAAIVLSVLPSGGDLKPAREN